MPFNKESDFEDALIQMLTESCGWEKEVLEYKTEKDLLQNWANILFENNRSIDRLNDYPLTDVEMQQIIDQIMELQTPLRLNGFINGRSVSSNAKILMIKNISEKKCLLRFMTGKKSPPDKVAIRLQDSRNLPQKIVSSQTDAEILFF